MKRGGAVWTKLKSQRFNYGRGLHYEDVENVAKEKAKEEKRRRRLDIIVRMNIKRDKELELPDGTKVFVKSISPDGLLTLDNWDEIDVLLIFP